MNIKVGLIYGDKAFNHILCFTCVVRAFKNRQQLYQRVIFKTYGKGIKCDDCQQVINNIVINNPNTRMRKALKRLGVTRLEKCVFSVTAESRVFTIGNLTQNKTLQETIMELHPEIDTSDDSSNDSFRETPTLNKVNKQIMKRITKENTTIEQANKIIDKTAETITNIDNPNTRRRNSPQDPPETSISEENSRWNFLFSPTPHNTKEIINETSDTDTADSTDVINNQRNINTGSNF